jgi:hypothetical protein
MAEILKYCPSRSWPWQAVITSSKEPGYLSRYSDWLRAGRPKLWTSSSGRCEIVLLFTPSRLNLGPTQPPKQWVAGMSRSRVRGSIVLFLLKSSWHTVYLVKHRDNFTFTLFNNQYWHYIVPPSWIRSSVHQFSHSSALNCLKTVNSVGQIFSIFFSFGIVYIYQFWSRINSLQCTFHQAVLILRTNQKQPENRVSEVWWLFSIFRSFVLRWCNMSRSWVSRVWRET